jgi:RimJ/RimL family protein N-acetyltransferase
MKDFDEMEGPPELSDGRVRLRALLPGDKDAVVLALNDPLSGRFLWRPPFPYSGADFDEFYSASLTFWEDFGLSVWIVAGADDDAVLGNISLSVNPERESGELGYWTTPQARGAGVTSAAARLVRDWAFDDLGLQRLEVTTDVDNIGSQRVAQALGMRREGLMRGYLTARDRRTDDLLYAMLPGDPRLPLVPLPWPELRDERLLVRPLHEDDAAAMAVACADGAIQHWIYRLPSPYGQRDAREYITRAQRRLAGGDGLDCAVLDASTGELLGSVGMAVRIGADAACGEIGYWVAPPARRRGVALRAARLLVEWAFEEAGLERLELLTYPGNEASQALATRLGFTRLGLIRGHLPAEPGKARKGRYDAAAARQAGLPPGTPPPRDDQVLFTLPRDQWEASGAR